MLIIVQVPEWISRVVAELKAKYSRDDFACVPKPRPEGGPPDWRMKCLDWCVVLRLPDLPPNCSLFFDMRPVSASGFLPRYLYVV
jgi:hypothetical protein